MIKGESFHSPFIFYFIWYVLLLLGIAHCTCFADYGNLDLSRIRHFILYLLGYFTGKVLGCLVVNLVCTDNDTQFTSGWIAYVFVTPG